MSVSVSPKAMLILADALTAQPFALRRGAMFLLRSFIHARTIAGPEITRRMPTKARMTCHQLRATKPLTRLARAEPIIPKAMPMAAKIPANLAMSKGWAGAGLASGEAGAAAGAALILSVASFISLASFSAALLLMRFCTASAILR